MTTYLGSPSVDTIPIIVGFPYYFTNLAKKASWHVVPIELEAAATPQSSTYFLAERARLSERGVTPAPAATSSSFWGACSALRH